MAENLECSKQHHHVALASAGDWKGRMRGLWEPQTRALLKDRIHVLWKRSRATLSLWHQRRQSRRLLAELPSHLLKDIGISAADRSEEVNKPFWKE